MMKPMLCPYKTKTVHAKDVERGSSVNVDRIDFCPCDYDNCYFFTTRLVFDKEGTHAIPECKRTQHDLEV